MEELVFSEVKVLPCMHLYHVQCISEWEIKHNTCPICRTVINPNKIDMKLLRPEPGRLVYAGVRNTLQNHVYFNELALHHRAMLDHITNNIYTPLNIIRHPESPPFFMTNTNDQEQSLGIMPINTPHTDLTNNLRLAIQHESNRRNKSSE